MKARCGFEGTCQHDIVKNFDSTVLDGRIDSYQTKDRTIYQICRQDLLIENQLSILSVLYQGRVLNAVYISNPDRTHIYNDYLLHDNGEQKHILRIFVTERPMLKLVS